MEGPEIQFAEAVIDNGSFGTRTIRFETGRLAKQAGGAVAVYLDDETMVLSTTTAGKHPREGFDFFPLTVDVEERQYAAGKIPGSFFRREGRPSTEAILACRLIDRPLRPLFVKGLRNEVQVVETVLSIHPDDSYDVVAINGASISTQISGLPFSGPVGAVRIALIDGTWVAFPRYSELERAVFSMVVAGRVVSGDDGSTDVAIAMIEAEATDNAWTLIKEQGAGAPTEDVVAEGLEAAKAPDPGAGRGPDRPGRSRRQADAGVPAVPRLRARRLRGGRGRGRRPLERGALDRWQAGAREPARRDQGRHGRRPAGRFDGREKELHAAYRSVQKKLIRRRIISDGFRIDGRGLRGHPHPVRRGRGAAPRARLGAVRARRDPDPGCHHAEHAQDGAAARHAVAADAQALHAQLQLPAVLDR